MGLEWKELKRESKTRRWGVCRQCFRDGWLQGHRQKSIFFYGELVCMFVDSYDLGQKNKRMN